MCVRNKSKIETCIVNVSHLIGKQCAIRAFESYEYGTRKGKNGNGFDADL